MAKRKRARLKWVVGSLAVLVGGGWGVMKVAEVMAARDVDTQASKLRKLGYPTTVEEFVARLPKDESQNAAPLYLKAIEEYKRIGEPKDTFTGSKGSVDREARAKFVRETDGVYQFLVQASQKEHCVFPRDWSLGLDLGYPQREFMIGFMVICSARTEVAIDSGDWRSALSSLSVGWRLVGHVAEPTLKAHWVAMMIEMDLVKRLESLISAFGENPQFVESVQHWLDELPAPLDRRRAFDYEIASAKLCIEQFADPERKYDKLPVGLFESTPTPRERLTFAISKLPVVQLRMHATYLERYVDALTQPYEDPWRDSSRWVAFDRVVNRDTSFIGDGLGAIMTPLKGFSVALATRTNFRRQFFVALWVCDRRNKLGTLPHQLPDEERFRDPWTGQRYVYIKRGEGFTIRSVGPNKVDDGGMVVAGRRTDDNDVQIPRATP